MTFTTNILRYGISGLISVACYVGLLWLFIHATAAPQIASNAAAYTLATLLNYLLNFYWSFASRSTHAQASRRFITVVAAGVLLNAVFVPALVCTGIQIELAALIFSAIWPLASFVSLKRWAFR